MLCVSFSLADPQPILNFFFYTMVSAEQTAGLACTAIEKDKDRQEEERNQSVVLRI